MTPVRKQWVWGSDEGFTYASGLGGAYYPSDGAPAGCQLIQFGGGQGGEVASPVSTWNGWGVPAGETVAFVELSGLDVRQDNSANSPAIVTIGLLGGTSWTIHGVTDQWQQLGPQGVSNIGAAFQAGSSPAQLTIGAYRSDKPVSNLYVDNLLITINGQTAGPSTGSVRRLVTASWANILASAALSAQVTAGKRGLSIWTNYAGQVAGSPWQSYNMVDVDDGAPIGLVFEQNGRLVLTYVRGGNGYYRLNDRFGERTEWTAEAALTGSAMVTNSGTGNSQVWKVRAE